MVWTNQVLTVELISAPTAAQGSSHLCLKMTGLRKPRALAPMLVAHPVELSILAGDLYPMQFALVQEVPWRAVTTLVEVSKVARRCWGVHGEI
jgi:hypothetical protein